MARSWRADKADQTFLSEIGKIPFGGLLRTAKLLNHHAGPDFGSLFNLSHDPLLPGVQIGDIIRGIGDILPFYRDTIRDILSVYRDMIGDIDFMIGDIPSDHQSAGSDDNRHPFVDPVSFTFAADDVLISDFDLGILPYLLSDPFAKTVNRLRDSVLAATAEDVRMVGQFVAAVSRVATVPPLLAEDSQDAIHQRGNRHIDAAHDHAFLEQLKLAPFECSGWRGRLSLC